MIRDPQTMNALLDTVGRFVREHLVPAENEEDMALEGEGAANMPSGRDR